MRKPPLFGEAPSRFCTRWLGDRNCGKPPVMHVLWDAEMENGMVCATHVHELGSAWAYLQTHELGPDCGMPNSHWFFDENVCRCVDDLTNKVLVIADALSVEAMPSTGRSPSAISPPSSRPSPSARPLGPPPISSSTTASAAK